MVDLGVVKYTFTVMNTVPNVLAVLTPPVKTLWINFGGLSLTSRTLMSTFSSVSSEESKKLWFSGLLMQFSVALTRIMCFSSASWSNGSLT